jgi:hypothetical protein
VCRWSRRTSHLPSYQETQKYGREDVPWEARCTGHLLWIRASNEYAFGAGVGAYSVVEDEVVADELVDAPADEEA